MKEGNLTMSLILLIILVLFLVGGFAELGLSQVWFCTIGHRRRGAAGCCCFASDRPALKGELRK